MTASVITIASDLIIEFHVFISLSPVVVSIYRSKAKINPLEDKCLCAAARSAAAIAG
jgi:hypothetical protein